MVLLAPNQYDDLLSLEGRFTLKNLDQWLIQLEKRAVHVILPKFKLETEYQKDKTLKAMGMVRAFDPEGAQFNGMTASEDQKQSLFISKVIHKAYVEVNEKGTEAAAATGVLFGGPVSFGSMKLPFVPTFKADRPFVFLIRDRVIGSILFVGRLLKPN